MSSSLEVFNRYSNSDVDKYFQFIKEHQNTFFGSSRWVNFERIPASVRYNGELFDKINFVLLDSMYDGRGAYLVVGDKYIYLVDFINGSVLRKSSISENKSVTESILDVKRKDLPSDIWDKASEDEYTLKPEVKKAILDRVDSFLKQTKPGLETKVTGIYLKGSLTSHYYTDFSDIDVNVFGEFSDEEMNQLLSQDPAFSSFKYNSKRPLNLYFRPSDLEPGVELKSVYDVTNDTWIKFEPDKGFVISDEIIQQAISWCRKLDLDIGELTRDIMEYKTYIESVFNIEYLDIPPEELDQKLGKKVEEIKSDIDVLNVSYKSLVRVRNEPFKGKKTDTQLHVPTDDPNWSVNNIIYKTLERFGYIQKLHRIYFLTKEKEFNPETDMDLLINILRS